MLKINEITIKECVSKNICKYFRGDMNRLRELDFFRHHIKFYEDMGRNVFPDDDEYLKWLQTVQTIEGDY